MFRWKQAVIKDRLSNFVTKTGELCTFKKKRPSSVLVLDTVLTFVWTLFKQVCVIEEKQKCNFYFLLFIIFIITDETDISRLRLGARSQACCQERDVHEIALTKQDC